MIGTWGVPEWSVAWINIFCFIFCLFLLEIFLLAVDSFLNVPILRWSLDIYIFTIFVFRRAEQTVVTP